MLGWRIAGLLTLLACALLASEARGQGGHGGGGRGRGGMGPGAAGPGSSGADLHGPDLHGPDLRGADMRGGRGAGVPGGGTGSPAGWAEARGSRLGPSGRWWDDDRFAQTLALAPTQQRRMDEVFNANRGTLVKLYKNLEHEQGQLGKLVRGKDLNETQIFDQIDRVTQARGELEKASAHLQLELRHQMTDNQTSRLDDLRGGSAAPTAAGAEQAQHDGPPQELQPHEAGPQNAGPQDADAHVQATHEPQ